MNERKPPQRRSTPQVEVIRRPVQPAAPVQPRPAPVPDGQAPPSSPPVPRPAPAPIVERRVLPSPRPSFAAGSAAPAPRPAQPAKPFRRSGPPRPPPTEEEVQALARREHVPARIARGELEGKMKARVWRRLHAEEAKRFDDAYALLAKHPGLELADAFGMVQSGMSVEELKARRDKAQKKLAVKEARGAVSKEAVDRFIQALIDEKVEASVVLGERTLLDVVAGVEPIAFQLERSGRLEKLQVVLLTRRAVWEKLSPRVEREPKLAQKPAPIIRQPERRPVSDPRVFLPLAGKAISLLLRNGVRLSEPLQAVGPFDLLVGPEGEELFVPLHAIVRWEDPAAAP